MVNVLTQFGDSTTGIGALGVDGKALIIQLVTFVLAILVLRRWAFKPILKVLNERRDVIENGVKLGEQMKKDKAELETTVTKALRDARADADKIIADAHVAGRQTVQEAEEAARAKADLLVAESKERIKHDTAAARQKLEKDVAGLVADATEAIIHEKIDTKKDAALIERALQENRQ